ncbi:MAG: ABC transporter substrate-binding protein [Rhodospirillaceae bacterium]|jgi:peptide/nickel transport system substrate-binding protein|nr:ABC transporter substrate-binding protein [Rhodospirillaceae bacterium]MBT5458211.1 ABC transporter substrate-binding protein [Rhodospirillaceae bacterium]
MSARRRSDPVITGVITGFLLTAGIVPSAGALDLVETPSLASRVQSGKLPPVTQRAPAEPHVVSEKLSTGRHGGALNILMSRAKDIRMMVVYGYARLVAYTENYELVPDILKTVDVVDGRRFTFHLRKGHRWSDGKPFTTEDFRYYWEDVANNRMLSPVGPPRAMLVNGRKPVFEVLNETTVRFSWAQPNPDFLPALAGPRPLYIYRPAHYLKRLHQRYADPGKLKRKVAKSGRRNWAALHNRKDNQYKNDNPKLPTLQPWTTRTKPPAQRFVFARNPYFHRVDAKGRQLPYIDEVVVNIAGAQIIPGKTGAGESDLQARYVHFSDYTFLKKGERRNKYDVRLWKTASGAHIALFPNLNANDPQWRKLFRDVRFRRALSLAINRYEINQVVYFGLTLEGNNTILPDSPLYKPEYRKKWATFDLKKANALLDSMGLTKRNDQGIRLLPDGRPMEVIVETAGEDTEQTDVLQLIHDTWKAAGIKLFTRPSQREVLRNRIFTGETLISVWSGLLNGLPTPDTSPAELAPTNQIHLQWPKWGQYYQTSKAVGEAPDLPAAMELMDLYRAWRQTIDREKRAGIWRRMLQIHADRIYTIGVVAAVPQPVVIRKTLRNVPREGVYNWNPGAHFGIYRPDTFWFADGGKAAK